MPPKSTAPPPENNGLPPQLAFLACRNCPPYTFTCVAERKEKWDVKVLNDYHDHEKLVCDWMTAHKLSWGSHGFQILRCVAPHLHARVSLAKETETKTKGQGPANKAYYCKECRRSASTDGPLVDNYDRSGFSDKLTLIMMWADGQTASSAFEDSKLAIDTVTLGFHLIERLLASWMLDHNVITVEQWEAKRLGDEAYRVPNGRQLYTLSLGEKSAPKLDHSQVDETHFCIPKDHRGRPNSEGTYCLQTLVLVDRNGHTVDFACTPISDKSWETLKVLIQRNISPLLLALITDGWLGYSKASSEGMYNYRILSHAALELGKLVHSRFHGNARRFVFIALAEFVGQGRTPWVCEQDQRDDLIAKQQKWLKRTGSSGDPGQFAPKVPFTSINMPGEPHQNPWFFCHEDVHSSLLHAVSGVPTQTLTQIERNQQGIAQQPTSQQQVSLGQQPTQDATPQRTRGRGRPNLHVVSPAPGSPDIAATLALSQSSRRARTGSLVGADPEENVAMCILNELRVMRREVDGMPAQFRQFARDAVREFMGGSVPTDRALDVDDDDDVVIVTQPALTPQTQMATQPAIITEVMARNVVRGLGRGRGRARGARGRGRH